MAMDDLAGASEAAATTEAPSSPAFPPIERQPRRKEAGARASAVRVLIWAGVLTLAIVGLAEVIRVASEDLTDASLAHADDRLASLKLFEVHPSPFTADHFETLG